ncbi:xanthine dehydrogenase family protein subunit M [Rhizobium johnstonii]|uniref:FAD binding domain-containing protein n=1 Tax=Rhizobium TaxID=379 RepID=UPI00102F9D5A|nr:FAD binding domain-containing protein [Rhizobium leguminosarum]TBH46058.1 molybdopterin dehydrogenase [Rhizobium leguminosarum]
MIRAPIKFVMPPSLKEAAELLARAGLDGRVVGGGSILVTSMSAGLDHPKVVIDPARLGLDQVVEIKGGALIGARATYAALLKSQVIRDRLPLLHAMISEVTGGPGLWNLATLGGSSCYANPASDGPACLVALRARFHLYSIYGERIVEARDFFQGAFKTARASNEILTHIFVSSEETLPRVAYSKLKHAGSSWPMVTAACQLSVMEEDAYLRLAVGGLAERPVFAEWKVTHSADLPMANDLATAILAKVEHGWSDELADGEYRLKAAKSVVTRVLQNVLENR